MTAWLVLSWALGAAMATGVLFLAYGGEAIQCCDACPFGTPDRQAIALHRVHCDRFRDTVLVPLDRPEELAA